MYLAPPPPHSFLVYRCGTAKDQANYLLIKLFRQLTVDQIFGQRKGQFSCWLLITTVLIYERNENNVNGHFLSKLYIFQWSVF